MLIPKILVSGRNSNTKLVNMAKFKIRLAGVPDILINVHASLQLAGRFLYTSVGDLTDPVFTMPSGRTWRNITTNYPAFDLVVIWLFCFTVRVRTGPQKPWKSLNFHFRKLSTQKSLNFLKTYPIFSRFSWHSCREILKYTRVYFFMSSCFGIGCRMPWVLKYGLIIQWIVLKSP